MKFYLYIPTTLARDRAIAQGKQKEEGSIEGTYVDLEEWYNRRYMYMACSVDIREQEARPSIICFL
jgi:hypothetical protein